MPAVTTKRDLLSALSRFFDPLGICLPVTTYAKLLFQATCKSKSTITSNASPLGWDEPLPADILAKWINYAAELSSLSEIFIDRCFRPRDFPLDGYVFDLLLYCDASPLAMTAIAFGRFTSGEQVRYSFIMGRGRLTPSSSLTIPRLELQSCVMAVRLAETIKKELRIPIASVEFRTDSQIVIHQLLSSHLERPEFVKSRLHEILRHSTTAQWFHVSGKDNVADDATRGLTPAQFLPNCRWLTGPSLVVRAAPAVNSVALLHLEDQERPTVCAVNQLSVTPNSPIPAPKSSRPSVTKLISRCQIDLAHLKREVALSLRDDPESTDSISVAELDEAMRVCLITAAEESFPREFKAIRTGKKLPNDSVLRNVSPYIDPADGLLKVDGV
jgi:ribonuclease HI